MFIAERDHTGANRASGSYGRRSLGALRRWFAYRALPWVAPVALVLGILLGRNAWLFRVPVYEVADMGAYSIQVEQARRFELLVGNYSRERFNHPGPAFLYVQAWGEDLFYALLRVVPAAWNGEVIGLYLLSAFFASAAVVVCYRWGGWGAAGAMLAVVGLLGALHPSVFSSDWMPYEYVPAYLAFLVSIASVAGGSVARRSMPGTSVAGGRGRDAWIAALSGWFLIHGHACFLFFVPLLSLAALAARLAPHLRQRTWPRIPRRAWLPVAVISAVFALPLVAELVLHWPGNFGRYLAYSSSAQSGGHPAGQVVGYVLWFWWPGAGGGAVAVVGGLVLAAATAAWCLPRGGMRRFCLALLGVDALSAAAFTVYAATGIDSMDQHYIGYFSWTGPAVMVLIILLAGVQYLARPRSARGVVAARTVAGCAAAACAVAGVAAFAVAPLTTLSTEHADPGDPAATGPVSDPALPAGIARLGALAAGRPVVISFPHDAWPAITGMLVQAGRSGVHACVAASKWQFMLTSQYICTNTEVLTGMRVNVWAPGAVPSGMPVLFPLRRGIVTYGLK